MFLPASPAAVAGLVAARLRPSVRLSVRPSVRPSVRMSVRPSERKVCVICNSHSFHSTSSKLCTLIIPTLKMWTSYFGEIWIQNGRLAAILLFSETEVCVICICHSFHSTLLNFCTVIEHTWKMCTSYFEQICIQNGRPAAIFLWNVHHLSKCWTFHHCYT